MDQYQQRARGATQQAHMIDEMPRISRRWWWKGSSGTWRGRMT